MNICGRQSSKRGSRVTYICSECLQERSELLLIRREKIIDNHRYPGRVRPGLQNVGAVIDAVTEAGGLEVGAAGGGAVRRRKIENDVRAADRGQADQELERPALVRVGVADGDDLKSPAAGALEAGDGRSLLKALR